MNIKAFFEIIRPLNCIMAAFAAFIGYSIALSSISFSPAIGIGMIVAFLVCGAGQAINDYYDREIDAKQHPQKPIPSGRIKPKQALYFSLLLFAAGIILSTMLPTGALVITAFFSILLILYSALIQKIKFAGNAVVALGTAFTLIFGATIAGSITVAIILATSAFFSNLARELIKDFEDQKADKGRKLSLPMIVSKQSAIIMVLFFYLGTIITSYIPFSYRLFGNIPFIVLITIANAGFLYSFHFLINGKYHKAQKISKISMVVALLGFLAGVFQ